MPSSSVSARSLNELVHNADNRSQKQMVVHARLKESYTSFSTSGEWFAHCGHDLDVPIAISAGFYITPHAL
jgi:hypothetical protein